MHQIGLRQFHEVVLLPNTETGEEAFYYFFAQVSLRKLLTETLDVVGYRGASSNKLTSPLSNWVG